MMAQVLLLVVNAVLGFMSGVLLLRFLMQYLRLPFRNPVGQFVVAASDWLVKPLRRVLPGLFGLDLASLLPAWGIQALLALLTLTLYGLDVGVLAVVLTAVVELLRQGVYLVIGAVIGVAVLSWVNPYAPLAPLLHGLADPFLRPFQRVLPTIGPVDISPLVLLLTLQVLLMFLDQVGHRLLMLGW